MNYNLFISYSRRDNEQGQVAELAERIRTEFHTFAGRELRVFFDTQEIHGMDDWRQKIQHSLRESHLFLAVLSPAYLESPYCRWEWEDYVRYEAMRQCLGEGVAPVFFVTLPDADDPSTDPAFKAWIDEIYGRQIFDLRPWHEAGEKALQEVHVQRTLEELHASVRERLNRAERARRSPANLLRHNPWFVGRVRELTELRETLVKNKLGVVGARAGMAAVQGLGGMGKTELALAYAHAFAWDYPGGRWQISCEHFDDLRAALRQLAAPMGFEFSDDENKSLDLAFERVLRELGHRERCLLVLDNVTEPALLEPSDLDRLPRDGQVDLIATTRLAPQTIPGSAQDQDFIAVDELPEEDAQALLCSHQPEGRFADQVEDDEAKTIARLLEGFTLAVETAAIYLGRHPGEDVCRRFRERLEASLLETSEKGADDESVAVRHRQRLLRPTLAITLETLSDEAKHLLTLASLLPADTIALPWLQVVGTAKFPPFSGAGLDEESGFSGNVSLLHGLRLFQETGVMDAGGRPLVARMHRLVQELVRQDASEDVDALEQSLLEHANERAKQLWDGWVEQKSRWELKPLTALAWQLMEREDPAGAHLANQVFPPTWFLGEYIDAEPLYRRALATYEAHFGPECSELATVLNNLANFLQATNRLGEAESLFRRAIAIDEQNLEPDDPNLAVTLGYLAQLLLDRNRLTEAESLMRRALAIPEKYFGPHHPEVAYPLGNLAGLLQDTNRLAEAEPLLRRTLAILEHSRPNHPDVATALGNLGLLLQATNRFAEAEPLLRRALAIDEQSFGSDHRGVATALSNLATLLLATNRLAEAESLMRRSLEIDERSFRPDHPKVAIALNNLATLLQDTNRLTEAESLLRRSLAIREESLGPDHPDVANALNNLAQLLDSTNRLSEAEPLMRRALEIDEKSFGPDHPKVATSLNNLARLLQATNRLAEAEPLMRRGLEIWEQSFGPDHPDVAIALHNVALLLTETNRLAEAEPLMRRALAIDEKSFGRDHPSVAGQLINLGELLSATNRLADAEPLMRRALAIREQSFGSDHSEVANALNNLAQLLQATNRLSEAEPLMRRALRIDEQSFGPDHPKVATNLNNLAQLLQATNRLTEAEPLMRRVLEILEQSFGPDHPKVASALNNLAHLLHSTNRLSEAESLMRRSLAIGEQSLGPDHSDLAIWLNNLAQLLKDTHRLKEAEPLMRRMVVIFLDFTNSTGHEHPHLRAALSNYEGLLAQMGQSQNQILARLDELAGPFGIPIGGD